MKVVFAGSPDWPQRVLTRMGCAYRLHSYWMARDWPPERLPLLATTGVSETGKKAERKWGNPTHTKRRTLAVMRHARQVEE